MKTLNENTKRLMLEAGYAAPELAGRAHKLVELLVKECAKVASRQVRGCTGGDLAVEEACLDHFGVKHNDR